MLIWNISFNGEKSIIYINEKNREMSIVISCISNSFVHTLAHWKQVITFHVSQVNLKVSR